MDYLFWAQSLFQHDIYFGLYSIFMCTNNKNIILHFREHSINISTYGCGCIFFPGLFLYNVSSFIFLVFSFLYVYVPEHIIGLIHSTFSLYPCPPYTATLTKRQRGCLYHACFNQGLSARHNTGLALF